MSHPRMRFFTIQAKFCALSVRNHRFCSVVPTGLCADFRQHCWAHARRKFFDLQVSGTHPAAEEALRRIAQLYAVEDSARSMDNTVREELRREHSLPILADMHDWLNRLRVATADGSGLARAIDYSLNRWPSLIRYAQTGNLPIDNNPVKNAIRAIARGKKNRLFAGSERAGKRAAAI